MAQDKAKPDTPPGVSRLATIGAAGSIDASDAHEDVHTTTAGLAGENSQTGQACSRALTSICRNGGRSRPTLFADDSLNSLRRSRVSGRLAVSPALMMLDVAFQAGRVLATTD